ncbi:MAG: sensor histidine kinase [Leptolyngbya sp. SIO1D8]|nr:sensor histidine kinase [Leptolyngbya sp. SIO1D8]
MKSILLRSQAPLRQLLYVEWILLGMAVFMMLPLMTLAHESEISWPRFLILLVFAVMGLRLPQHPFDKVVYLAAEFGLLLFLASQTEQLPLIMRMLPQLGLVMVIRSCQMFQSWGRVLVLGAILGLHWFTTFTYADITPDRMKQLMSPPDQWQVNVLKTNAVIFFGMVMIFVSLLVNALLAAYRSQQKLALAHEELRRYATKVENQATLQERNRIAREIHDSLGHALTAQTILLENALLFLPANASQARDYVIDAKDSAYQTLREVAKSVSALRTNPLPEKSLPTAIPTLIEDICKPAQIRSEHAIELPESLPDEVHLALFRIVQEALTNTVKHSQATWVKVMLTAKRDRLHLQVLDNGQGFDPSKNTTGFGLRGMRERAIDLGGTFQIWSAAGEGCRISIIVPLSTALNHPA